MSATDSPPCTGTQTLVVHNGTRQTMEVVRGSGVALGQVVDVLSPGQRSTVLRLQGEGNIYLRDQVSKRVADYRDLRIRYEYGCQT